MRKIEALMIDAIQHFADDEQEDRHIWKLGNTEVVNFYSGARNIMDYERFIEVSLHGNKIAKIYPGASMMWLMDSNYRTATTKSRLNSLCRAFTENNSVYSVKDEWRIDGRNIAGCTDENDSAALWKGEHCVPFGIKWHRHVLQTARGIAVRTSGSCYNR